MRLAMITKCSAPNRTNDQCNFNSKTRGFTLIEFAMVVLLIAVISAIAVSNFIDFQKDAKSAAAAKMLSAIEVGITNQKANMIFRCDAPPNAWPAASDIQVNNITNGNSYCTEAHIPNPAERKFLAGYDNQLPPNPAGDPPSNFVIDCSFLGTCPQEGGQIEQKEKTFYAIFPFLNDEKNTPSSSSAAFIQSIYLFEIFSKLSFFLPKISFASTKKKENVFTGIPCAGLGSDYSNGWCYNSASGSLWADARNPVPKTDIPKDPPLPKLTPKQEKELAKIIASRKKLDQQEQSKIASFDKQVQSTQVKYEQKRIQIDKIEGKRIASTERKIEDLKLNYEKQRQTLQSSLESIKNDSSLSEKQKTKKIIRIEKNITQLNKKEPQQLSKLDKQIENTKLKYEKQREKLKAQEKTALDKIEVNREKQLDKIKTQKDQLAQKEAALYS